jgi:tetratricopeptide (TPR) repeat protein
MEREWDKAISDYSRAIELYPWHLAGMSYFGRGIAYNYKGEYDLAIEDYNEASRQNTSREVKVWRGIAYKNKKEYRKARMDWERRLEEDSDNKEARALLDDLNAKNLGYYIPTLQVSTDQHSKLRLRAGPGTNYERLDALWDLTLVQVLEKGPSWTDGEGDTGNWLKVETKDFKRGWAFDKYLAPISDITAEEKKLCGFWVKDREGDPYSGPGVFYYFYPNKEVDFGMLMSDQWLGAWAVRNGKLCTAISGYSYEDGQPFTHYNEYRYRIIDGDKLEMAGDEGTFVYVLTDEKTRPR